MINLRRIRQNMLSMTAAQVVSRGFATVTTIYLARTLGPGRFGMIEVAITALLYAELLVNAGFNRLGPREIARGRWPEQALVNTILALRLLLAVAGFAVMGLFAAFWPGEQLLSLLAVLYGLALFLLAVDLSWLFVGREQMQIIAVSELLWQGVMLVGVLLLVRDSSHVVRVPLLYIAAKAVGSGILLWQYRRGNGRFYPKIDHTRWRGLLQAAVPLAIAGLMAMITFNFDTMMIGWSLGSTAAGLYGAAYRIVWLPSVLITAYFTAIFPAVDRLFLQDKTAVARLLYGSTRLTSSLGMGIGVGGSFLAAPLFAVLYTEVYQASVPAFQVLVWAIALMFVSRNFRVLLVAADRQQYDLWIMSAAAVTNVALNFLLIPRWGLVGAAVATVLSEGLMLILGIWAVRDLIGGQHWLLHLLKLGLAGGGLTAVFYISSPLSFWLQLAVGGLSYLLLLLTSRIFSPADLQKIRAELGKK